MSLALLVRSHSADSVAAAAPETPTAVVRVVPARAMRLGDSVEARGEVRASEQVAVKTEIDGRVVAVHFRDGSDVHQGDLLFELDSHMAAAREGAVRADVRKARAALANWQREEARTQSLVSEGFLSQSASDAHGAGLEKLQSELDRSVAELEVARIELTRTRILAPISGRVGHRLVDPGTLLTVAEGTTLVDIVRADPAAIVVAFPSDQLDALRRACAKGPVQAQVHRTDGGASVTEATLASVANAVDRAGATVEVRLLAVNADHALWPGQQVDVHVPLGGDAETIVIPQQAVFRSGNGDAVWILDAGDVTRLRPVTTHPAGNGLVRATGVAVGERVVVDGQDALAPGMRSRVAGPRA